VGPRRWTWTACWRPSRARSCAAGPELTIGLVHLHAGDLDRGLAFYHDVLGFDVMMFFPGAAAFVSVGGYHHHLAFNVWRGEGVPSALPGRVGLSHWTVWLDDPGEVAAVRERVRAAGIGFEEAEGGGFVVRDPWEIAARFVARDVPDGVRKRDGDTDPRGIGTT
jgi:catechol 2,3-dioxygenase